MQQYNEVTTLSYQRMFIFWFGKASKYCIYNKLGKYNNHMVTHYLKITEDIRK